jgi:hypothetical protein
LIHRAAACYAGGVVALAGLGLIAWAGWLALTAGGIELAPILLGLVLGGHRLFTVGSAMINGAWTRPELILDGGRIVIDDATTLVGRQSIPFDLVDSVYIGPEVAGWLVTNYSSIGTREVQLGRYPQFPNMVIVFNQSVLMNQARFRQFRLWHLTKPPSPTEPIQLLWATVEDPDAAYLIFHDRGLSPEWATDDLGLVTD